MTSIDVLEGLSNQIVAVTGEKPLQCLSQNRLEFTYSNDKFQINTCSGSCFKEEFTLENPPYLLKTGIETSFILHIHKSHYVYKLYDIGNDNFSLNLKFQEIKLHNYLFSRTTKYEIVGFAIKNEDFYLVTRQPYIEFINNSDDIARQLLKKDLRQRFGTKSLYIKNRYDGKYYGKLEGDWHIKGQNISLDDLKSSNIGIDKHTKKYAVIDCIIHEETFDYWKHKVG